MTIPQTWIRTFAIQLSSVETEIWRPGTLPTASVDVLQGTLDGLLGATEINLPPIVAGSTWSGVSVEFLIRPAPASALRFPVYTWDIAADRKGTLVDVLFAMTGAGARSIDLSREASLMARIRAGSVATSTPIFLWGSAIEINQY